MIEEDSDSRLTETLRSIRGVLLWLSALIVVLIMLIMLIVVDIVYPVRAISVTTAPVVYPVPVIIYPAPVYPSPKE